MRVLPNLQYEQDILLELVAQYDRVLPTAGKRNHVVELCRLITLSGQVRAELAYPCCVGRAPGRLVDAARIRLDLVRVLVTELLNASPDDFIYDALFETLGEELQTLFAQEEGLWASAVASGLDVRRLDVAIGVSLRDLDRQTRTSSWAPFPPETLGTLIQR